MANQKPLLTKHWLALLGTLFVIVLIAHLAIITSVRGQFGIKKSEKISTFTTRMIELPTPTPVVEKTPEVVTPLKPAKSKTKVTAAPKEVPNPTPATQVAPALVPIPVESVAASAPPPEQIQPTTELATPTLESAPATPAAASGDSGQPPSAFTAPVSGKHLYKVTVSQKGNIYKGNAEALLQQDGGKYALRLSASQLLYSITWKSTGLLSPQGFMPERFSDKRTLKSEVAAHFDRAAGKIIFSTNTPQATLEAGAQDRISIIWQLAGLLAAEPARYPPGTTLSIQTADDREAQTWVFTVNEPETLNLENGSQVALRLTRNPRHEFDRKIELWLAPAMGYLLVRFRQTQTSGDYDDMVWQSTQTLPNILQR
jgi:hypothetical protein